MVPYSVISPYLSRRFAPPHPPTPAWENPVTRGMFFMFTGASTWRERPGSGAGNSFIIRDCVQGRLAGDSSAPHALHTIGQGPNGVGYQFAGDGSRASSVFDWQFDVPESAVMHIVPATWVFVFRFESGLHRALGCRSSGTAHTQGWNVGDSFGLGVTLLRSTTNVDIRCSDNVTTGLDTTLVITHDGSNSRTNSRIFVNGDLQTQIAGSDGTGTSTTAAAQALQFGNCQQLPSDGFIGRIYLGALFSRQMGDAEARDVSANPWQLVQRRKTPVVYFPQTPSVGNLFFGAGTTQ